MKVIIQKICEFEIEIPDNALDLPFEQVERAVRENWDTYYRSRATWRNGLAPVDQPGGILTITKEH